MDNFEQIRAHLVSAGYKLTLQDPFLACVELSLSQGRRHQAIFLSELQDDDGRNYLRVSTALAPITGIDARRALAFNWEKPGGLPGHRRARWRALPATLRKPPL